MKVKHKELFHEAISHVVKPGLEMKMSCLPARMSHGITTTPAGVSGLRR